MSRLDLQVIRGEDLKKADLIGGADPYVVVTIDGMQKWQTKVVKNNNKNPQWNESHSFTVQPTSRLQFRVMDKDRIGRDDVLGSAEWPVSQIRGGAWAPFAVNLIYKGRPSGRIFCSAFWQGMGMGMGMGMAGGGACYDTCAPEPMCAPSPCEPVMCAPAPAPAQPRVIYRDAEPLPEPPVQTQTVYVADERDELLRRKLRHRRSRWERELLHDRACLQDMLREEQALERAVRTREADLRMREARVTRLEAQHGLHPPPAPVVAPMHGLHHHDVHHHDVHPRYHGHHAPSGYHGRHRYGPSHHSSHRRHHGYGRQHYRSHHSDYDCSDSSY
eukprot:TRINITY_DN70750_c0_g1_i1.p1 TRINITY_DN70750_c0_g1~~TRINITY_DN70750_c0_g1_i1.p1  ORF type:complete len:347 (-),score=49.92 TRINITY_DN70750_c0_g1_i1:376-1368(-)